MGYNINFRNQKLDMIATHVENPSKLIIFLYLYFTR